MKISDIMSAAIDMMPRPNMDIKYNSLTNKVLEFIEGKLGGSDDFNKASAKKTAAGIVGSVALLGTGCAAVAELSLRIVAFALTGFGIFSSNDDMLHGIEETGCAALMSFIGVATVLGNAVGSDKSYYDAINLN